MTATVRVRGFRHQHRVLVAIAGGLATAGVLGWLLAGRREEFGVALSEASWGVLGWFVGGRGEEFGVALAEASGLVLGATVALQVVALLSRTEAWHQSVE